jgi:chaperonin cofactor prefoldin
VEELKQDAEEWELTVKKMRKQNRRKNESIEDLQLEKQQLKK